MPWSSKHIKWLVNTGNRLKTSDGKIVEIWELHHKQDETILSAWAKHFRNHYCLDTDIDDLRNGTGLSRRDYLNTIRFPSVSTGLGPAIRSGDFGEILVADYLQYILGYWVPRNRYAVKHTRNESTKGCDVIGFKYLRNGKDENDDILAIFESKSQLSKTKIDPLRKAVLGSAKDPLRKAESLNAIKQYLRNQHKLDEVAKIERFQNQADRPYYEIYGAVAFFSSEFINESEISQTKTTDHPFVNELSLLVIHGPDMMNLVHELYRRAADEA